MIRPDGFITLPLVDEVKAAGLTPAELKETLTKLFSARLNSPEVTIIALQVPPPVVYVLGEVNNNTAVPLRNAPTASAAITYAGGFRRSAKSGLTSIIRLGDDGLIRAIPVSDTAKGQPGGVMGMRGVLLQADDIIFSAGEWQKPGQSFPGRLVNRPMLP